MVAIVFPLPSTIASTPAWMFVWYRKTEIERRVDKGNVARTAKDEESAEKWEDENRMKRNLETLASDRQQRAAAAAGNEKKNGEETVIQA